MQPKCGANAEPRVAGFARTRPQSHDSVRVRIWKRLQQDTVDDAEYDGAQANAKRQGCADDRCPRRRLAQHSQAVAYILERPFDSGPSPSLADIFLNSCGVAKHTPCSPRRFVGGLARFYALVLFDLHVRAQLFRQIVLFLFPGKPPPDPALHSITPEGALRGT